MRRLGWLLTLVCVAAGLGAGAVASTFYNQYWNQLPPIERLHNYDPPVATRVYAANGDLVETFFFERRFLTPIREIPAVVRHAFVAAEDADFYSHHGVDLSAIARATLANLRAGNVVQGGSTITQQVVKALLLTPERSYERKLREVMLALRLEREVGKDEILYLYLNQIYLGDGNYGVGAASRSYFGKTPAELTLAEAALLAGLPQAPSRYSPTRNPQGARTRQRYVLGRMLDEGFITAGDFQAATREETEVLPRGRATAKVGSYYTEYVRRYLEDNFGKEALYYKGFRVYTGMDIEMQGLAEAAVRRGVEAADQSLGYLGPLERLEPEQFEARLEAETKREELSELKVGKVYKGLVTASGPGTITVAVGSRSGDVDVSRLPWHSDIEAGERRFARGDVVEVEATDSGQPLLLTQSAHSETALVAIDPADGQVKAMVGGFDFSRSEFNRAIQAKRQPGSAFKPLVYAAALDNGYTPASVVLDAPIQWVDHDNVWAPQNYSRRFYGPTTLRKALEKSRNVVTVRVVQDLGVETVVDYISRFGFQAPIGRNLSVGLGTSETSLLELTSAYSVFPNGGKRVEPALITRIEDASGKLIETHEHGATPVMSEQTAYLITSMLEGVVQRGTGKSVRDIGRPAAGKTGTTNDQHDAWFVGFTPDLVTGVWLGYDDDRTLGRHGTGGRMAAPVWLDFMREALIDAPVSHFSMPEGISCVLIDPATGSRATATTEESSLECFKSGTEPSATEDGLEARPAPGSSSLTMNPRGDADDAAVRKVSTPYEFQ